MISLVRAAMNSESTNKNVVEKSPPIHHTKSTRRLWPVTFPISRPSGVDDCRYRRANPNLQFSQQINELIKIINTVSMVTVTIIKLLP